MKTKFRYLFAVLFFIQTGFYSVAQENQTAKQYLGQWSLFLPGGAGWLEVRQEGGYLDADILWYGGSVVPVASVYIIGEDLVVTKTSQVKRPDNNGNPSKTHTLTTSIEMSMYGDQLAGKYIQPMRDGSGVKITKFRGVRLPASPHAPDLSKVKYGDPVVLFNGKDLSGWTLTDPTAVNGWSVKEEELLNNPLQKSDKPHIHYGNLRTVDEYEDFNLKLQVSIPEHSNSGVYMR